MNPILHRCSTLAAISILGLTASVAHAQSVDLVIQPVRLPDGITLSGSIQTDGSVGPILPDQLLGWRVVQRLVSRLVYKPANAATVTAQQVRVTPDGRWLQVRTSPDGVRDGGLLAFGSFGPGPEYGVQLANFTATWANGGTSFYVAGANFEWQWLDAPPHHWWTVARASGVPGRFTLTPVAYASGAVLGGWLQTDGRTGLLPADAFVDWSLTVRSVQEQVYYKDASGSNSVVAAGTQGLSSDGQQLWVSRPGGFLGFATPTRPPARPSGVTLADFGPGAPAGGQAGWYSPFGLQYGPLHFTGSLYPVAASSPSP